MKIKRKLGAFSYELVDACDSCQATENLTKLYDHIAKEVLLACPDCKPDGDHATGITLADPQAYPGEDHLD